MFRAHEAIVFPAQGHGSHGSFGGIVVDFEEAVINTKERWLGFSSPNQPNRERGTADRDSLEPASLRDAHRTAFVGDWEGTLGDAGVYG